MNASAKLMLDAIHESGTVTLAELKRQGVMVHAALCELLSEGVAVKCIYSPSVRAFVYWIGGAAVNPQGCRPFDLTPHERRTLETYIDSGKWYTHKQLAEMLRVHRERAARIMHGIKSGVIEFPARVTSRRRASGAWLYRFDSKEAAV